MTTKLIILLIVGGFILGLLTWMIVRAARYRRRHPDETYWPYYGRWERHQRIDEEKYK